MQGAVDIQIIETGDPGAGGAAADSRLAPDTEVLGGWDGKNARAYPIEALAKAGVIHDQIDGGLPRIVLWYSATRTAAAFHQPWGTSGIQGDAGWIFGLDP